MLQPVEEGYGQQQNGKGNQHFSFDHFNDGQPEQIVTDVSSIFPVIYP